jgi:hypothetical protein
MAARSQETRANVEDDHQIERSLCRSHRDGSALRWQHVRRSVALAMIAAILVAVWRERR